MEKENWNNVEIDEDEDEFEWKWQAMRSKGCTEEEIQKEKQKQRYKDDIYLYKQIIASKAWETDCSCTFAMSYIHLSYAYDGLNNRNEALNTLKLGHSLEPHEHKLTLALAKLLFRADFKLQAFELCVELYERYALQQSILSSKSRGDWNEEESTAMTSLVMSEDVSDAYYLAGWIHIHDDNHTKAYGIWSEGATMLPDDVLLRTQAHKRKCWDRAFDESILWSKDAQGLVGDAKIMTKTGNEFRYVAYTPLMQYTYANGVMHVELHGVSTEEENVAYMKVPALSLFDASQGRRGVVFGCKTPVLTADECDRVLDVVYDYHKTELNGVWGTVRHSSVKTTDVAVENIPQLRNWLLILLHTRLNPMLNELYPILADGSSLIDPVSGKSRMRVHDSFIVRYDADVDMSLSLPEHCDTSAISIVVSLSSVERGDYVGGGTWFEALDTNGKVVNAEIGEAVAFAGPLKHAGYPVSKGVRHILVLFMYIEGYHYGPLLTHAKQKLDEYHAKVEEKEREAKSIPIADNKLIDSESQTMHHEVDILPSGGEKNGFVVYRQTVDLVNMLERTV